MNQDAHVHGCVVKEKVDNDLSTGEDAGQRLRTRGVHSITTDASNFVLYPP